MNEVAQFLVDNGFTECKEVASSFGKGTMYQPVLSYKHPDSDYVAFVFIGMWHVGNTLQTATMFMFDPLEEIKNHQAFKHIFRKNKIQKVIQ